MGQAKLRGNRDARVAEAQQTIAALRPDGLVCNNCKTEFKEFDAMDARGLPGITAVFAGICPNCKDTTFAYRGDPEAIAELVLAQQDYMGGGEIGFQKIYSV